MFDPFALRGREASRRWAFFCFTSAGAPQKKKIRENTYRFQRTNQKHSKARYGTHPRCSGEKLGCKILRRGPRSALWEKEVKRSPTLAYSSTDTCNKSCCPALGEC